MTLVSLISTTLDAHSLKFRIGENVINYLLFSSCTFFKAGSAKMNSNCTILTSRHNIPNAMATCHYIPLFPFGTQW